MIVLGLTGSIGMGKTETAKMFAAEGVPVYDADAAVHQMYQPGGAATAPIGQAFPHVIRNGGVDREALAAAVFNNPPAMQRLEQIVHPLVKAMRGQFLARAKAANAPIVLLDIPLLFETGSEGEFDAVVVVTAPAEVQRKRVLARPGMSQERFKQILEKQLADSEKVKRADFVINTAFGLEDARAQVRALLAALRKAA